MKVLYEYKADYGRMGTIEGLFVAHDYEINEALGKTIYFGEILGKHSDISLDLILDDLTIKSSDEDFINKLVEIIGSDYISGYCPLDYIEEEE